MCHSNVHPTGDSTAPLSPPQHIKVLTVLIAKYKTDEIIVADSINGDRAFDAGIAKVKITDKEPGIGVPGEPAVDPRGDPLASPSGQGAPRSRRFGIRGWLAN